MKQRERTFRYSLQITPTQNSNTQAERRPYRYRRHQRCCWMIMQPTTDQIICGRATSESWKLETMRKGASSDKWGYAPIDNDGLAP